MTDPLPDAAPVIPAPLAPHVPLPPPPSGSGFQLRPDAVETVKEGISMSSFFLAAVVALCTLAVIAVLIGASIPRPKDEPSPVPTITNLITPIIMALLAGALYGQNRSMNGRLTQLQNLWGTAALKRGQEAALQGMMWRLQTLDPQSTEYKTLADLILAETMAQAGVIEKRRGSPP